MSNMELLTKRFQIDYNYLLNDNIFMNIKQELKLRNISINECATKTGIPYGALYPIVNGNVKLENCKYSTLKKLCDFLCCNIDDLFTDFENFSVFWKDEKTADVFFDEKDIHIKRYTTNPAKQIFFSDKISNYELGEILTWRCWDKNRENIEKYLYELGLTEFNPYKICRKTHGVMYQDKIWFRFEGEIINWKDIKCN